MRSLVRRLLLYGMLWMVGLALVGCATFGRRALRPGDDGAPKVGNPAPLFALKTLADQDKIVELASFRGARPVVLFFGSYT